MVKVQRLFVKTNLKIQVCHTHSWQGLEQARPNKKLSHGGNNFQELKICGHGTILALINNRKPRTAQLIQLTVLGFLVSELKYCFMKPLLFEGRGFLYGGKTLGCRPNPPEGYYPSDSLLRFAAA